MKKHTYVCTEFHAFKTTVVLSDDKNTRVLIQFANHTYATDDDETAAALDAVLKIEGNAVARHVQKIDREKAEAIARQHNATVSNTLKGGMHSEAMRVGAANSTEQEQLRQLLNDPDVRDSDGVHLVQGQNVSPPLETETVKFSSDIGQDENQQEGNFLNINAN